MSKALKAFTWYKKFTQIAIENDIYRKKSTIGEYGYFYCKRKNCPGSCRVKLPIEKSDFAELINQHENHSQDISSQSPSERKDIRSQAEPIIKSVISQYPDLNIEGGEKVLNDQYPEMTSQYNKTQLRSDINNVKISCGGNDGVTAAQTFSIHKNLDIQFLRTLGYYVTYNKSHKFIMWATEWQLGQLRESTHGFIDATFGMLPNDGFYQLLVIAIYEPICKKITHCCFVAMSTKKEEFYIHIFSILKSCISNSGFPINLKSVTIDFEKACFPV